MSAAGEGKTAEIDPQWAWAPFQPDTRRPWDLRWAGHLYRRAGFGANWSQLEQAIADGPQRAVQRLMGAGGEAASFQQTFGEYEQAAERTGSTEELRAWWLRRMIETPHPLLEKMTLFWHSHFGISAARVKDSRLMGEHVRTLRDHALGLYRPMMEAIAQDPAVFLGLDAGVNRKTNPNQNFPSQLLERFSLGAGHYGQEDLREAARAFTGWFVLNGRLRFVDREHDTGVKNILGLRGNWRSEDVVRIALAQPAAPRMILRRLCRWFVSEVEEPHDSLIDPLAAKLAESWDIGHVVETILRSNLFFSPAAYRRRVKSPVEFAVGIIRSLEARVPTVSLGAELAQLGQSLYHPPTLKGWYGGEHWISAATQAGRMNLAEALLSTTGPYAGRLDPSALAQRCHRGSPEASAKLILDLFLQNDIPDNVRTALQGPMLDDSAADAPERLREFTYRVLSVPEYQLC